MPRLNKVCRASCAGLSALLCVAMTADDPATYTPILGGSGGTAYTHRCPAGSVLTGFEANTGQWIDRLRIVCTTVNADGQLGATAAAGAAGGTGGSPTGRKQCSSG